MSPRVRTEKREGGIVRISHLGSAADIQGEDKKKKKASVNTELACCVKTYN